MHIKCINLHIVWAIRGGEKKGPGMGFLLLSLRKSDIIKLNYVWKEEGMSDNKQTNAANAAGDLGSKISQAVDEAVRTKNYQGISSSIRDVVSSATKEVVNLTNTARAQAQAQAQGKAQPNAAAGYTRKPDEANSALHGYRNLSKEKEGYQKRQEERKDPRVRSHYKVSRTVQTKVKDKGSAIRVLGWVFTIIFGIGLLGAIADTPWIFRYSEGIMKIVRFIIAVVAIFVGTYLGKTARRKKHYLTIIGDRGYISVQELASSCGISEDLVRKDIRSMIMDGVFRQPYFDQKAEWLMLTPEARSQYLAAMDAKAAREAEARLKQKEESATEPLTKEDERDRIILNETRNYRDELRIAMKDLAGTPLEAKTGELLNIVEHIMNYILLHPEQASELRKFSDYYLPLTLKLLRGYKQLSVSSQGENAKKGRAEIEDSMDLLIGAFRNMYDSLYSELVLDVSSDLSVLKTMLSQDGLVKDGPGAMKSSPGQ